MNDVQILGDWGSTRLRLWRLDDGRVTDRREGPGIVGLGRRPVDVLRDWLSGWPVDRVRHVTLCGMVGGRGGLHEVSYTPCPADRGQWADAAVDFALDELRVRVAAGCACDGSNGVRDLMRGEETQIFGAMTIEPAMTTGRHKLLLPGTHSKWVTIEDGRIAGFRTFLTGELFARLRESSLLPANVATTAAATPDDEDAREDAGFAAGLATANERSNLLADLFLTRAAQVDGGRSARWATAFLSGLLIGTECVAGIGDDAGSSPIRIIGAPELARRYAAALNSFGAVGKAADADACTLSGLAIIDERH